MPEEKQVTDAQTVQTGNTDDNAAQAPSETQPTPAPKAEAPKVEAPAIQEETEDSVAKKVAPKTTKPTAKKAKNEVVEKHLQMVQFVQNTLWALEADIKRAKLVLSQLAKFDPEDPKSLDMINDAQEAMGTADLKSYSEEDAEVVEGKFDGYFMVGSDQKKYPVPLNYSSKTKLVPGDVLKLKILNDGKFIYKLIRPIERKHLRAMLSQSEDAKFIAVTDDGKTYFLNQAAVTFFKGKPGDELYILTNANEEAGFAAIEAIIKK